MFCVISGYELLGSGLETLELSVGRNPSGPKHSLSSHGWGGERGASKSPPNILLPHAHAHRTHTRTVNDCSSPILWPRALSLILRFKKEQTNKLQGKLCLRSHTSKHTRRHTPSHKCHCTHCFALLLMCCCCSNQSSAGPGLGLFTFSEQAEGAERKKKLGGQIVQREPHIF